MQVLVSPQSADISAMLGSCFFFFLAALSASEACQSIGMAPMQQMPQNMIELMPESLALMSREYTTRLPPILYTTTPVTRFTRRNLSPATAFPTRGYSPIVYPSATTTRYATLITTKYPSTTATSLGKTTTKPREPSVKWSCSSAMVQIETVHPWDQNMSEHHRQLLDEDLKKLEQHSQTTLASFGDVHRKVASVSAEGGEKYGELFFIRKILKSCNELKEFVRKAVSWSKDNTAKLVCRDAPPTYAAR